MTSKAIHFSSRPNARGRVYSLILPMGNWPSVTRQVIRRDAAKVYECQECNDPTVIPGNWSIIGAVDNFHEALQWLADEEDI